MAADDGDGTDTAMAVAKGAVFALGAIAAIGIGLALLETLVPVVVVAGAAYLGYRVVKKSKSLGEARPRKMLGSNDDFDRRMAELDAVEKKLDAEIRRGG